MQKRRVTAFPARRFKIGDYSGGTFLVQDSVRVREARVTPSADFHDEAAEFAVVSVLFQA